MIGPRVLGRDPHFEEFITSFSKTVEEHPVTDFLETRAKRAVTGAVTGAALGLAQASSWKWVRFGARGAVRLVPYVGWALLAYDLYELGDEMELY